MGTDFDVFDIRAIDEGFFLLSSHCAIKVIASSGLCQWFMVPLKWIKGNAFLLN